MDKRMLVLHWRLTGVVGVFMLVSCGKRSERMVPEAYDATAAAYDADTLYSPSWYQVTHGHPREGVSRPINTYRNGLLRLLKQPSKRWEEYRIAESVITDTLTICPTAWHPAIQAAAVEETYPLELVDRARGAWCMALELGDDSIVKGALRIRLEQEFPEIASRLAENEEMVRLAPD